ncbi:hypothetical protein KI387_013159, partial [Taxus chinensis]
SVPDSPGQSGQKYAADIESRRSREPIKSRHVSSSQRGTGKPESGGSKEFVPDSLGQLGQRDVRDVKIWQACGQIKKRHVSQGKT